MESIDIILCSAAITVFILVVIYLLLHLINCTSRICFLLETFLMLKRFHFTHLYRYEYYKKLIEFGGDKDEKNRLWNEYYIMEKILHDALLENEDK